MLDNKHFLMILVLQTMWQIIKINNKIIWIIIITVIIII